MKNQRKKQTSSAERGKIIGDINNIKKHARDLLQRLPSGVTAKKAKKKALAKMIQSEYAAPLMTPKNFKSIRNKSIQASVNMKETESVGRNKGFLPRATNANRAKKSDIRGVEKTKYIAEAVFNNRNLTYSKSSNISQFQTNRRGKTVIQNGVRFTDKEIKEAQTKYKHIYDREIQKLTQKSHLSDTDSEGMLISKLYEHLSMELNKQKGTQREERDL